MRIYPEYFLSFNNLLFIDEAKKKLAEWETDDLCTGLKPLTVCGWLESAYIGNNTEVGLCKGPLEFLLSDSRVFSAIRLIAGIYGREYA